MRAVGTVRGQTSIDAAVGAIVTMTWPVSALDYTGAHVRRPSNRQRVKEAPTAHVRTEAGLNEDNPRFVHLIGQRRKASPAALRRNRECGSRPAASKYPLRTSKGGTHQEQ